MKDGKYYDCEVVIDPYQFILWLEEVAHNDLSHAGEELFEICCDVANGNLIVPVCCPFVKRVSNGRRFNENKEEDGVEETGKEG